MINAIALKLRLQGKAIVSYGPDVLWPTATLLNAEESSLQPGPQQPDRLRSAENSRIIAVGFCSDAEHLAE